MRVGRQHLESPFPFHERDYVVGEDSMAIPGKGCRGSRFSSTWRSKECDASPLETHGAGMQTGDSAQPQK
jgi:hypothetical protein